MSVAGAWLNGMEANVRINPYVGASALGDVFGTGGTTPSYAFTNAAQAAYAQGLSTRAASETRQTSLKGGAVLVGAALLAWLLLRR